MTAATTTQPSGGGKPVKPAKRRRGFGVIFNLLLLIGIVVVIGLFVWAEQQRRAAQQELQQTASELQELRESSQRTGQQVAAQVLERLRGHIDVPSDPEPTVATIVDVERLREANEFYQQAENGDHLIITERRAILYDADRDIILDVVPVQINSADNVPEGAGSEEAALDGEASPSPAAGEDGEASPSPSPSPDAEAGEASPSPSPETP